MVNCPGGFRCSKDKQMMPSENCYRTLVAGRKPKIRDPCSGRGCFSSPLASGTGAATKCHRGTSRTLLDMPVPMTLLDMPVPVTLLDMPVPVTLVDMPVPVTLVDMPVPVTLVDMPVPVTLLDMPVPMTLLDMPVPVTLVDMPVPMTLVDMPVPVTLVDMPVPMTLLDMPVPVTLVDMPVPVTLVDMPVPMAAWGNAWPGPGTSGWSRGPDAGALQIAGFPSWLRTVINTLNDDSSPGQTGYRAANWAWLHRSAWCGRQQAVPRIHTLQRKAVGQPGWDVLGFMEKAAVIEYVVSCAAPPEESAHIAEAAVFASAVPR